MKVKPLSVSLLSVFCFTDVPVLSPPASECLLKLRLLPAQRGQGGLFFGGERTLSFDAGQ
jgi:hypothetical protein